MFLYTKCADDRDRSAPSLFLVSNSNSSDGDAVPSSVRNVRQRNNIVKSSLMTQLNLGYWIQNYEQKV